MRLFQYSLAVFALLSLAGWLWLRQPYSPTQDLPAVSYTAFEVFAPTDQAGFALAQAARNWQGITASTYAPASGLLVVSHTTELSEQDLQGRLQILCSKPISKKNFPELAGPKCPVPQAALAALPNWFLGIGIVLGLGSATLFLFGWTKKMRGHLPKSLITNN